MMTAIAVYRRQKTELPRIGCTGKGGRGIKQEIIGNNQRTAISGSNPAQGKCFGTKSIFQLFANPIQMLTPTVAQEVNAQKNDILYNMQMCLTVSQIPLCLNKIQKSCLGPLLYVKY